MVDANNNEKMEDLYFDFQAEIGITKYMGAIAATSLLGKQLHLSMCELIWIHS